MKKKMEKDESQGMDRRTFLKASSAISLGAAATFGASGCASTQTGTKTFKKYSGEKIDMFCHILPPKYQEALFKKSMEIKPTYYMQNFKRLPALWKLDIRFRAMDKYEGMKQILDLGAPPIELVFSPKDAVELAKMANDEMAELLNKYPDRFVAAVAGLPLNNIDAAIREAERAIKDLKFKGVQIYSSVNGKPLDRPEFLGLYEKMAQYDLPIWIHPVRENTVPDYPDEKSSKYGVFSTVGWPFDTTVAMMRLVFSGIMEKYPNIKFISHHCGAMVPFFYKRVLLPSTGGQSGDIMKLTKPPVEYLKRFYADTVLGGNTPALMCGYAFFGAHNMLFASDYPYPGGAEKGDIALGEVVESVDQMNITDEEKKEIFSKNARRILKLS